MTQSATAPWPGIARAPRTPLKARIANMRKCGETQCEG